MAAKTIAIWGKNGCGKTVLALNLAHYLAQNHGLLVGLISAADYAEIPSYLNLTCPANKGMKAARDTQTEPTKNFYIDATKDGGLYLLSPSLDTDSFEMAGFDKATGRRIIQESKEVFDVVVVDCTTEKENAITGEALALSDRIVIPVNDDVAYPQWYRSNIRLFDVMKVRTMFVESMVNGYANIQAIFKSMGVTPAASLQYIRNTPAITNEGGVIYRGGREQKIYEAGLNSLWEAIRNGR